MPARHWLAALLVGGAVSLAAPAWAAMSPDQVSAMIAEVYGVTVLRVEPVTEDDQSAYIVTIMNPGGDFNAAFQVYRIVVDAETGKLIPQFRHLRSGHQYSGTRTWTTER